MKKLLALVVILCAGVAVGRMFPETGQAKALEGGHGGAATCSEKNGDVNADGKVDLTDAVTVLGNLFLGQPPTLPPLCPAPARGVPDTGQKTCYRVDGLEFECSGLLQVKCPFQRQDAQIITGCPNDANRFSVNADDTITDNCTGLQWQRFTADLNGDGESDTLTWCEAFDYCNHLTLGGQVDWRLPNVRELQSIVDYGRMFPAADPLFRAEASNYWSSTSNLNQPSEAWVVIFNLGSVITFEKNDKNTYVRAVRGGS